MLTLHQLKVFAEVAKRLNITQVARDMRVSQPALTKEIKQLENNLGIRLIVKRRRGIELTDAGATLRFEIETILSRVNGLQSKSKARAKD